MSIASSEQGVVQASNGGRTNISGVVFTVDMVTASFPKAGQISFYMPLEAVPDIRPGDKITANFDAFSKVVSVISKSGRVWKTPITTVYR